MGRLLTDDPSMNFLAWIARSCRNAVHPCTPLAGDRAYRRIIAELFGVTDEEAVNFGFLPKVAKSKPRKEPKSRGIMNSLRNSQTSKETTK